MKKRLVLTLFLLSLFSFAQDSPDIDSIKDHINSHKAIVVDVREQSEIKEGMLLSALSFPLSKTQNNKQWPKQFRQLVQGREVMLYCRSGSRAQQFKMLLKEQGIESQNIGGYMKLKNILPTNKGLK